MQGVSHVVTYNTPEVSANGRSNALINEYITYTSKSLKLSKPQRKQNITLDIERFSMPLKCEIFLLCEDAEPQTLRLPESKGSVIYSIPDMIRLILVE